MGVEITAKTLGVIGCGNIGSIAADRAIGLKMRVIAYDPFLTPERAVKLGVEKVELDELLARADFITLHVPMTEKTKNILSRDNLAKTKKGVRIINCARGAWSTSRRSPTLSRRAMSPARLSTSSRWSRLSRTRSSACRT